MNLTMIPIAMSKGPIAAEAYDDAVHYSTKRTNSVPLNSTNFKALKPFLFSRKLATWCCHLKKEPIAIISQHPEAKRTVLVNMYQR